MKEKYLEMLVIPFLIYLQHQKEGNTAIGKIYRKVEKYIDSKFGFKNKKHFIYDISGYRDSAGKTPFRSRLYPDTSAHLNAKIHNNVKIDNEQFYYHSENLKQQVLYYKLPDTTNLFLTVIYGVIHFLSIFLIIAFYTLLERKIMGSIQRRKGPNVNGFHGLLQPLADGLKLIFKEIIIPNRSNRFLFVLSPIFFLAIALSLWSLIPFGPEIVVSDPEYSVLLYLVLSGISIYGVIFAGWSSNSKYPFLGALRAVAQMISYEVVLGFIILIVILVTGSVNFMDIAQYQIDSIYLITPLLIPAIAFFITILAETNRAPFDLAEAESELVSGYNVEYSGILFAMFFLAEYSNMITLSACGVLYFFGGWGGFFAPYINISIKILIFMYLLVIVRAVLPRFRYDQLMIIGWRVLLPIVMMFFLFTFSFYYYSETFFNLILL